MTEPPAKMGDSRQDSSTSVTSNASSVPSILTPNDSTSQDGGRTTPRPLPANPVQPAQGSQTLSDDARAQSGFEPSSTWHMPVDTAFTFRCFHNTSPRPPQVFPARSEPSASPSAFQTPAESLSGQAQAKSRSTETPDESPIDRFSTPREEGGLSPPQIHSLPRPLPIRIGRSPRAFDDAPIPVTQYHELDSNQLHELDSTEYHELDSRQYHELDSLVVPRSRAGSSTSVVSETSVISVGEPEPYDVRNERKPQQAFYADSFQNSLSECIDITHKSALALNAVDIPATDSGLQRLKNEAETLYSFEKKNTRTVAVLGDSGEGKSSVINSLLHYPDIARTGDLGSAETAVVTEYRQKTEAHTAPITIEVEHLSAAEIKDLIVELVWSYSKLYFPGAENVSDDDYKRHMRESALAWSTLEAAFSHRQEFNRDLLQYTSEESMKSITEKLTEWAEDIRWPAGETGNGNVWKAAAETAKECCEKTSTFMQDRYWPFTKIIRVYLSSQVLKAGIVLADLPGLQDTNLARVKATQDYLCKSDHILIVSEIKRVATKQSVKDSLFHVLKTHVHGDWENTAGKYLNVAVVCTKTDEIDEAKAKTAFCGPGKRIEHSAIDDLDRQIKVAKTSGDRKLKKRLQLRRKFHFVSARNAHVKDTLQNFYREKVPGGALEVFCVSNTVYGKYTRKGNLEMVNNSGVPDLRRFCYMATGDAQHAEARHYMQARVGGLLKSMQIWAAPETPPQDTSAASTATTSTAAASLSNLTSSLPTLLPNLITAIHAGQTRFLSTFTTTILSYQPIRSPHWQSAATSRAHDCSAKRGFVNWNQELIWKMKCELDLQWDVFEDDEIPFFFDEMRQSVETEVEKLKQGIRDCALGPEVEETLEHRMQSMAYEISVIQQSFAREVRSLRRKTVEGNQRSYIFDQMLPSYRTAAQDSGKGMNARQIRTVTGRVESEVLFPGIVERLKREIEALVEKTVGEVVDQVEEGVSGVEQDLVMAISTVEAVEREDSGDKEEDRKQREEQKAKLAEELRELRQRYDTALAAIR
ncbi:MAG: hypothetical protein Q9227_008338 [Pyrenula ochraceoflavens]